MSPAVVLKRTTGCELPAAAVCAMAGIVTARAKARPLRRTPHSLRVADDVKKEERFVFIALYALFAILMRKKAEKRIKR